MHHIKAKIKRAWYLWTSAELTVPEFFNLSINKCIYLVSRLFNAAKGLLVFNDANVIVGYDKYLPGNLPKDKIKRALEVFLHQPFYKEHYIGRLKYYFSNNGTPLCAAQALNELGYKVDVIHVDDKNFKIKKNYDIVYFLNSNNPEIYQSIRRQLPKSTLTVYFDGVAHWRMVVANLERRYQEFNQAHQRQVLPKDLENYRIVSSHGSEVDKDLASVDGIIVLGDQLAKSYDALANVHKTGSAVYADPYFQKDLSPRHLDQNRRNFLFFGGSVDNIRKGLDLLLESFIGSPNHLYICAAIFPFMEEVFQISRQPNIHLIGYVKLNTKKFYRLIQLCNFVIHPSCAEGIPGGVLETMKYGLIPVVTQECNLPVKDFGLMLDSYSVAAINKAVAEATQLPPEDLAQKARAAVKEIEENFSIRSYVDSQKSAILEIIKSKKTEKI